MIKHEISRAFLIKNKPKYYHYPILLNMKRYRNINEATEEAIADLEEYIREIDSDINALRNRAGIIKAFIQEKNAPKRPTTPQPFQPEQGQYVRIGTYQDGRAIVRDNTGNTYLVDQTGRAVPFNGNPQQNNQGHFDPNHNHLVGGKEEEKKGNWFTGTVGGAFDGLGQILSMPGHAISGLGRGLVSENIQSKRKFTIKRK